MTYCIGMLVDSGLVFLCDSRTNAGVDQISTFRKITLFERPGDRVLVADVRRQPGLVAGGDRPAARPDERRGNQPVQRRQHGRGRAAGRRRRCARCIGATPPPCKEHKIEFNVSLILGGQIGAEPPRLFCVYAAGNFIEATSDTPYFQIGESKYGKPIIDRVVSRSTSLAQAAKCALISMDSTIRSNLSVGLPLDLLTVQRDALRVHSHVNIDEQHAYFRMVRTRWSESLRHAFHELPDPDWIRRS